MIGDAVLRLSYKLDKPRYISEWLRSWENATTLVVADFGSVCATNFFCSEDRITAVVPLNESIGLTGEKFSGPDFC